jgi:hypothetical protein
LFRVTACQVLHLASNGKFSEVKGTCTMKFAQPIQLLLLALWFCYIAITFVEIIHLIFTIGKLIPSCCCCCCKPISEVTSGETTYVINGENVTAVGGVKKTNIEIPKEDFVDERNCIRMSYKW